MSVTTVARRVAGWITGRPKQALALLALLTVAFGVGARDVRLDNDFAALFSTSSADARFREEYRTTFGADDGLLVAVLDADRPSEAMFAAVGRISTAVADMAEVEHVDSVTTLNVARPGLDDGSPDPDIGLRFGPAFSDETADLPLDQRIEFAARSDLGPGNLISPDGRTTLVVGNLAAKYNSYEEVTGPADEFRAIVDREIGRTDASVRVHYAGVAFTRIAAISEMQGDLLKLSPLATLMMALLLWWYFRRPIAVIAPMVAIVVSIVCTAGVIGLAGDDINQVTIVYPVLLMGVVVATATHLVHRFYRERAAGADPETAARTTLERVSRAAVVCTATNAIGFVSLLTAKMSILHEFGLYLAAGIGFCFVSTSVAVPALLVLRRSEPPARYLTDHTRPAGAVATRLTQAGTSRVVYAIGLALVAGSVLVSMTARYDYSLSGMLNSDRPTSVGNALVDSRLAGIVPIEISLRGESGAFERLDAIERMQRLRDWLSDDEGIRTVGLPSAFSAMADLGIPAPTTDAEVLTYLDGFGSIDRSGALARVLTDDRSWTRLRGFHRDTGSTDIVHLAERIDAEGAELFAGTGIDVQVTGEAPVAYAGMNELSRELILATIIAVALIVIAIGVAFRSITLALVALLPNVVPISVGLAIYTLVKETLDPVAGVVFCVAMGLAADDTVHILNRYRELRPTHTSSRAALDEALATVRRAMVSSSAVLIASFLALGVSGFPTNRTIGVMGSLVLLIALGSDVVFGTAGLAIAGARADRRGRTL